MLSPAEREQAGHGLVGHRRRGDQFANLQIFFLRRTADPRHHFGGVALDMLAQEIDDAAWILPAVINLGKTLLIEFIVPARLVVAPGLFVVAAEQPGLKTEAILH